MTYFSFLFATQQRNATDTVNNSFLKEVGLLLQATAYGTMEQHVVGDIACGASVALTDHARMEP